jgi:polyferredoxin
LAAGNGLVLRVSDPQFYQLLADVVLAVHVAVVVFVVGGLVVIIIGNLRAWRWVNAPWFRLAHLASIMVVVAQTWLGAVCPLTSLEMSLRAKAQTPTYTGSFIEHWLQRILYYDAPSWVFVLGYSLFGLLVVAIWWRFPPRFGRRARAPDG